MKTKTKVGVDTTEGDYILELIGVEDSIFAGVHVRVQRLDPEKLLVVVPGDKDEMEAIHQGLGNAFRRTAFRRLVGNRDVLLFPPGTRAFRVRKAV